MIPILPNSPFRGLGGCKMKILSADIGSTYTKLVAIDTAEERVVATSSAFTTIETDVMEGFDNALQILQEKTGGFEYDELLCCSSAAGGLKMVALGLVPELTAKAAKLAAASAGAKVVKTYSFEISQTELDEIAKIEPDLVLLSGGTDGGNKEVIIANARRLTSIDKTFTTIVAGNKSAVFEIEAIFQASNKAYFITENVMPEFNKLNIEPAKKKISEVFINQIIEAKGLNQLQNMAKTAIIPTPLAVLNACELLSLGTKNNKGLGDLLAIDLGGATTDVYSIADGKPTIENATVKGLPEPRSKRTVEGDLGMRYSLQAMIDELDLTQFADEISEDIELVDKWIKSVIANPEKLAESNSKEELIELNLAKNAVRLAVERHVGTYESVYTPFGQMFALTGKDLIATSKVIGIGGAIINAKKPTYILEGAKKQNNDYIYAKPLNPNYYIDKKYIFASMGLLSSIHPELALSLLKKEIIEID